MNSALMISPAISSLLLGIWDVSKEALEQRDLDGLVRFFVCVCFPSGRFFLFFGGATGFRVVYSSSLCMRPLSTVYIQEDFWLTFEHLLPPSPPPPPPPPC